MIPASVRIFVAVEPQDMRRGFERLALAAGQATQCDPRKGGALFCFVNKRRNRLKVLWHDGSGWCVLYKRGQGVLFEFDGREGCAPSIRLDRAQLAQLVRGVETDRRRRRRALRCSPPS